MNGESLILLAMALNTMSLLFIPLLHTSRQPQTEDEQIESRRAIVGFSILGTILLGFTILFKMIGMI